MGARAKVIVGNRSGYELYASRGRGLTLDAELFFGPERAIGFARGLHRCSEGSGGSWLDEVQVRGGAVIDPDARVVLWFGGDDLLDDVPVRRVHLALMRELWPGWDIRWACDHVCDLARYLGRDAGELLVDDVGPWTVREVREPDEPDWISFVLSIRSTSGRIGLHALDCTPHEFVLAGPSLVAALAAAELPREYDYSARSQEFPLGGLHIDEGERRVDVWLAAPVAAMERRLRAAWAGWDVHWHQDEFEKWHELIGPRLVLPIRPTDDLVSRVRASVMGASAEPAGTAQPADARRVQAAEFERAVERWRRRP